MEISNNYSTAKVWNTSNKNVSKSSKKNKWKLTDSLKEKMIEVPTSEASLYRKGDSVVVTADSAVGFRASFYGYLLPLILMVIALVGVLKATHSEGAAALSALGILVPYYVVLYLFQKMILKPLMRLTTL